MNRALIAAAFAAAVLPGTALDAVAAPLDHINRTYSLGCAVDQTDGVSLKSGMIVVRNTSPHLLRQGTALKVVLMAEYQGRRREIRVTHTAFRDVPAGQTIAFQQRYRAHRCVASVTLQPNLKAKLDKVVR